MLQFLQAKEQGKAEMEELLTKLQKVCQIFFLSVLEVCVEYRMIEVYILHFVVIV